MATRRGKGEGSITQRRDGRWEARLTLPQGGRRQRRAFYGKTRAEAARKLRDALRKQDEGLPLPPENLTLEAHLRTWLEAKRATLRPETWRRYNDLVGHIIPVLGRRRLPRLTVEDVQALHDALAAKGLSGTTMQHAHGVLHAALQDALRWNLAGRNVASLVPAPRRSTGEMRHLSPADARALMIAAKGEPLEAFFVVALTAGLREGELQALRWKDVDLDRQRVRVTATLTAIKDGAPVLGEPKTQHSRRTVWLTLTAVEAIERHRADQDARRRLAGPAWVEYGLVFCSDRGLPLWRSQVRTHWLRLLAKAEIPHLRVHDLRHSAATLLLAEGVPVKVASEMLGHSDVTTTLRIYAHVLEGAQEQAASAMDRLLNA
jgi:integrase